MSVQTLIRLLATDTLWGVPRQHVPYGVVILGLFVLAGCASAFNPPPLSTTHPAHPEAMAAPAPPASTTLAYGPADIPSLQPASYRAQSERHRDGQHGHGGPASGQEKAETFVGEGQVIAVVTSSGQLVVAHGEIKGFMDAMTMGYQVEPPALLEQVKAGDTIRFTIDPQKKAIIKIEKQ